MFPSAALANYRRLTADPRSGGQRVSWPHRAESRGGLVLKTRGKSPPLTLSSFCLLLAFLHGGCVTSASTSTAPEFLQCAIFLCLSVRTLMIGLWANLGNNPTHKNPYPDHIYKTTVPFRGTPTCRCQRWGAGVIVVVGGLMLSFPFLTRSALPLPTPSSGCYL